MYLLLQWKFSFGLIIMQTDRLQELNRSVHLFSWSMKQRQVLMSLVWHRVKAAEKANRRFFLSVLSCQSSRCSPFLSSPGLADGGGRAVLWPRHHPPLRCGLGARPTLRLAGYAASTAALAFLQSGALQSGGCVRLFGQKEGLRDAFGCSRQPRCGVFSGCGGRGVWSVSVMSRATDVLMFYQRWERTECTSTERRAPPQHPAHSRTTVPDSGLPFNSAGRK